MTMPFTLHMCGSVRIYKSQSWKCKLPEGSIPESSSIWWNLNSVSTQYHCVTTSIFNGAMWWPLKPRSRLPGWSRRWLPRASKWQLAFRVRGLWDLSLHLITIPPLHPVDGGLPVTLVDFSSPRSVFSLCALCRYREHYEERKRLHACLYIVPSVEVDQSINKAAPSIFLEWFRSEEM